jgi:hypothetical protein
MGPDPLELILGPDAFDALDQGEHSLGRADQAAHLVAGVLFGQGAEGIVIPLPIGAVMGPRIGSNQWGEAAEQIVSPGRGPASRFEHERQPA